MKKPFCPRYEGIKKVLAEGPYLPESGQQRRHFCLLFLPEKSKCPSGRRTEIIVVYGAFLRNAVADAYFPLYKEIMPMAFCQNRHKLFFADYLVMDKE